MSEEEIVSYLQDQKITSARRIKRRTGPTTFENTPTVVLTVNSTYTPEFINFGYLRVRTRPYYPSPMQCFKCWAFGHTKVKCRQETATYGNCSENHEIPAEGPKCQQLLFCRKCRSSEHSLASRPCPEYRKENTIQKIKIERDIDYRAARLIFEAGNCQQRSYADVTRKVNGPTSNTEDSDRRNNDLLKTISEKDLIIANITTSIESQLIEAAKNAALVDRMD
ncbi:uncharacterized protein LOC129765579 [Toxorhynchites rutilus septentrionalis]|uniref:uncharacterized protein LOC129765579 n=1 Tax=Toxorhynchites rutilus septentrionalis TaxID=329112 RepID=UPI00247A0FA7|nr:uncharacterized protein LOC129765579 [Toxorhynchites rutilus septentrionalis]